MSMASNPAQRLAASERDAILEALPAGARAQVASLQWLAETASTQADALAAPVPAQGCALFLADRQHAGQGRRGRRWVSPPGANLYLSLSRRFAHPLAALSGLSLAAGVAVVEALHALGVHEAGLKWPNDVLAGGRKLGGLLVNLRADSDRGGSVAIVGLGLNLRMPDGAGATIDQPWCDLAMLGHCCGRVQVAARVIAQFAGALAQFDAEGIAPFLPRWQRLDAYAGREARIVDGVEIASGTVLGIDASGALRLRVDGVERRFHGGELSLRPA
jgi:BirA family biotin operon repressor/biotin-[acetyl-CoA-carboxylase] ligase